MIPIGRWTVILIPACSSEVGKLSDGYEVSHNLNSGWVSGPEIISSQIEVRFGSQDVAR